jgi:hypothetical protein
MLSTARAQVIRLIMGLLKQLHMKPFVIMKGIKDGLLSEEKVLALEIESPTKVDQLPLLPSDQRNYEGALRRFLERKFVFSRYRSMLTLDA